MYAEKGAEVRRKIEKHRLSIIIPIYNVEAYLEQCLESIVVQIRDRMDESAVVEVILVDDGSTDRSGEIADNYAAKCDCMQVIHEKNTGVAAARNNGIEVAQGEWLYFMDSDDWMSQDGVALLLRAVTECSQADMILLDAWQNIGTREMPWEHFRREAEWRGREEIGKLQRGVLYYPMEYPETKVPLAAPWDKLYRREFLEENRLKFREELHVLDDMVFNMEVLGVAAYVAYRKYKVCHYRHVSSSITNRFRADRVEEDTRVWMWIVGYRKERYRNGVSQMELQAFDQAFFCRIIRSFAICCRLSFYHSDNRKSYRQKQKYVCEISARPLYREAFMQIRKQNLEWRLRAVVFLVRHGFYGGLYLLHLAEGLYVAVNCRR